MAKTKFGVFSLSQFPDLAKVVESFDNDLGFFELAEQLGYDKVWIAEHLFSTYGLVTSTQVYAAAIAQRTKKIRIGMAVCAIPFNHPLRTASDFALVDILFAQQSGRAGIPTCLMPSGESASTTALTTAGGMAMHPASPTPLAPSGLRGEGVHVFSMTTTGTSSARGIA